MADPRVRTGIEGLDDILCGGLPKDRLFLLTGEPGTGKTTLAMQFLIEGVRNGERSLYVTLSETAEELRAAATSHEWNLGDVQIVELMPPAETLGPEDQYTIFHPSDIELGQTTRRVFDEVEQRRPARLVLDSLAELRLLAHDPLRYRRQILALKQFFVGRSCTVVLLDDRSGSSTDGHLESISHGVILLERRVVHYGGARRRLQVVKMRGVPLREGYHDFVIETGGLRVYPRLVAAEHRESRRSTTVASGVAALDQLLGGGLDSGTSTLILGPAGCGKSTLAQQYAAAAAARGDRAAFFLFEESPEIALRRADGLGLPTRASVDAGRILMQQVDPVQLSPGEFVCRVRRTVDERDARVVVIDSLNGYLNAMPEERLLVVQMHELLSFLNQRGVLTLLVVSQLGMLGPMQSPVDVTYLADAVVLLRFYESCGALHQAISVLKKRTGRHERTIRELTLGPGVNVGEPLTGFQGVLTGVPILLAQNQ
jgi:circadian clock protein KaiC